MGATGRASQKKTQLTLRFTPDEIKKLDYMKSKMNFSSNNELFIHLMYDYDNVTGRADFQEKEKDRYKEELEELKTNSQQFLSSFKDFEKSANKEVDKLNLNKYNRW